MKLDNYECEGQISLFDLLKIDKNEKEELKKVLHEMTPPAIKGMMRGYEAAGIFTEEKLHKIYMAVSIGDEMVETDMFGLRLKNKNTMKTWCWRDVLAAAKEMMKDKEL